MSRIDEALKRVSGATVSDRCDPAVEETGLRVSDALIDQYPHETRPAPQAVHRIEKPRRRVAVPLTGRAIRHNGFDGSLKGKLVVADDTPSVSVEQYRRLAAAVHELQIDSGLKTLMVTSALPREGKTLTVTNLALTLTESYGRRVLLIDADLRRPSIHQVFNLANVKGLGELLRSDCQELPAFEVTPRLSVLPAGRPDSNPIAGLTSDRMRELLEHSAASFDWVLVDAPPVTLLPDAQLLARLTRAVIFVIGAGSTPYAMVERAVTEVGRDSIVGTVLNRIGDQHIPATEYYGEYVGRPAS
jgi:protein-tyrosine kinase